MQVTVDVTSKKTKVFDIPHGRIARIVGITIVDTSGAANSLTLTDEGNYYNGSDFSSPFTRIVVYEKFGANETVVRDYSKVNRDILNSLYAVSTGNATVVLDMELL